VQFAAGMIMHPPGYLRRVRELTRRYGVLMIADEVAVGMGRTGTMFACEQEGVTPDFLCLGKGLSGGYLPIAATITNDHIYHAFLGPYHAARTLHHGHTFSGNPLSAAAALASLDLFDEEQTLAKLPAKIDRIARHLAKLADHRHVSTTRQRGLVAALELTPDKSAGVPYPADERRGWQVCRETLRRGVWLRPLGDVLYVAPPLAISLEEIDRMMETLAAAIDTITSK
jgi:adenosylmethionine-8-amino-7-oxononanoate aminotransferase